MSKLNILLIAAIISIAMVGLSGVASASGTGTIRDVTFTVDSIHRNGHYIGTPVLISGETRQYGYNYTFVFDGSYTINGHAINNAGTPVEVSVDALSSMEWGLTTFTVPADTGNPGRADFSVSVRSLNTNFDSVGYIGVPTHPLGDTVNSTFIFHTGELNSIITDAEDTTTHTINYGPMSDMAIVYDNSGLSSNASIVYALNQSGDDYKALYTNGKFNFNNSPLYAFAE